MLLIGVLLLLLCNNHYQVRASFESINEEDGESSIVSHPEGGADKSSEKNLQKEGGFVFVMPKQVIAGSNVSACMTLHSVKLPAEVKVDLLILGEHYVTQKNLETEFSCLGLDISLLDSHNKEPFYINVSVTISGINKGFWNMDPVWFLPRTDTIILQTDRQKYKPGDKMKIRLVAINEELLSSYKDTAPVITIKNPVGDLETVWENELLQMGLLHLEYNISERAYEGTWTVQAGTTQRKVDVTKEQAPRFEIHVNTSSGIYVSANAFNYRVCGTYPFGRPVKGIAIIKLTVEPSKLHIQQQKETRAGCADFTILAKDFNLPALRSQRYSYYDPDVKLQATIIERGTDLNVTVIKEMRMTDDPYHIRINFPKFFRSNLPMYGELEVVDILEKVDGRIRICYNIHTERNDFEEIMPCVDDVTFNENNKLYFTIPPLSPEVRSIYVTIGGLNKDCPGPSYGVHSHRIHSPSGFYVYLQQISRGDQLKCGSEQHFTVYYSSDREFDHDLSFYYVVKSPTHILAFKKIFNAGSVTQKLTPESLSNVVNGEHKFTKFGTFVGTFNFSFVLDEHVETSYQILIYTVLSNGEILADSKNIDLQPCYVNKVKYELSRHTYRPGESVELRIAALPHTLCSLVAVTEDNYGTFVNDLVAKRKKASSYGEVHSFRDACIKKGTTMLSTDSTGKDASGIFKDFGGSVLTNLRMVTKPCGVLRRNQSGRRLRKSRALPSRTAVSEEMIGELNKETALSSWHDTWLWDLIQLDDTGIAEVSKITPPGISKWYTNVLCMSRTKRLSLSNVSHASTFKPFFIDVIIPLSITRGENARMIVKVFNYYNYSISTSPIVFVDENLSVTLADSTIKTIESGDAVDYIYKIKGKNHGRFTMTVEAEFTNDDGTDRDVVIKEILIEPEGYSAVALQSNILCSDGLLSNSITWNITVPEDAVVNYDKSQVYCDADRIGFPVESVGELLLQDTDDLEQILIPCSYILRYLKAVRNKNTSFLMKYLQQGYEKTLTFKNHDGSFKRLSSSNTTTNPSVLLTVFAIRNLVQSKQYISVDESVIASAIRSIYAKQRKNGCFEVGPEDHYNFMPFFSIPYISLEENIPGILTSYVLSKLLEAGIEIPESVTRNAKECIFEYTHNSTDQFIEAISSYALVLSNSRMEGLLMLEGLVNHFQINSKLGGIETQRNTEILAYILLSLFQLKDTSNLPYAREAVQWITKEVAKRDVFQLTQTVTVLDALSCYGVVAGLENNVKVQLISPSQNEELTFGGEDGLKMKKVALRGAYGPLQLNISGEGCVFAKVEVEYNTMNLSQGPAFLLNLRTDLDTFGDYCARKLKPCVALGGPYAYSYKTVLEISLPSGFQPVANSLYHLQGGKVTGIRESSNQIIIHIQELTDVEICTPFTIVKKKDAVNETYSASVKVYDYYKHEFVSSEAFNVPLCNSTDSA